MGHLLQILIAESQSADGEISLPLLNHWRNKSSTAIQMNKLRYASFYQPIAGSLLLLQIIETVSS
jgi:hypothetical protein